MNWSTLSLARYQDAAPVAMMSLLLRTLLGCLLLVICSTVYARIDLTPLNVTDTIIWSGADVEILYPYCVPSTEEPGPGGTTVIPYGVMADVNGTFEFSSGASVIPFQLYWADISNAASPVEEQLSPGVDSALDKTADVDGCPGGNNGQLRLFINYTDLVAAGPGAYNATINLEVFQQAPQGRRSRRGKVTLTLDIPDSIRLTQVSDILLGNFDGVTDMSGSDAMCVYRRGGGLYSLRIDGAAGVFELTSGPGSAIPFTVSWNDGAGAFPVTSGQTYVDLGNVYTQDEYCQGGAQNNATLVVDVTANAINSNATVTGPHQTVLTITVIMQ